MTDSDRIRKLEEKRDLRDKQKLMSMLNDILMETDLKLHKPFDKLGFDEAYFDVEVSLNVTVNENTVRIFRSDNRLES